MNIVPLGSVFEVQMGQAPDGSSYNETGDGLPLLAGATDFGEDFPTCRKFTTAAGKISKPGDLLLGIRASIGDINWADKPYCLGRGVAAIRPKDGSGEICYLAHWLRSNRSALNQLGRGSTFKQISREDITSFAVPLPSIHEQKRIAAILDKADAIRRKREQAIKLADEFLRSLFLDMFGDPVGNPKGWPVKAMSEAVAITQYGTAEKSNTDPSGIPVLRMNNITYEGRWNLKDLKYMPAAEPAYLVEQGDLLFNRTNSQELVGKTAVWTSHETFAFAGYLIRVRFKPGTVSPCYASAYLNSSYGKRLLLSVAQPSINMSNISASTFRRLPIPIPPINLQIEYQQIAARTEGFLDRLSKASKCDLELSLCLSHRAFSSGL